MQIKKFRLPFYLLATLLLTYCTTAADAAVGDGYNIKLKVRNGVKDTTCLLAYHYGNQIFVEDTFRVDSKGLAVFSGKEALAGGIYLAVLPGTKYFEFLVNDGEQHFSMEVDTSDFVNTLKINGSPSNTLFNEYQRFLSPRQSKLNKLSKELTPADSSKLDSLARKAILDKMKPLEEEIKEYRIRILKEQPKSFLAAIFRTMKEPETPEAPKGKDGKPLDPDFGYKYYKGHFWDNVDFSDSRLVKTPLLYNKINYYLDKLVYKVPDSINFATDFIIEKARANKDVFKYALGTITHLYETSKIMGMDAIFVHLVEKYYLTGQATWMDEERMKKVRDRYEKLRHTLIGNKAPDIKVYDVMTNQPQNLSAIKADYTILLFWSHNCGHCKKSMPKYIEFYNANKSKGVEMFSVSTEVEADKIQEYLKENPQPWTTYYEPTNQSRFRELYDIYSTPVVYLLDKDKKVKAKRIDVEQLQKVLDAIRQGDEHAGGKVIEKENHDD